MGNYTDLWKGEMLKYQLFQLGIVGMALLFIFVTVWYAILGLFLYVLGFQYYLVLDRAKKKEKHEGERHIDSHTLREKDYREDKIYSFRGYEELDIHSPMPTELEEMPEYQVALNEIINEQNEDQLQTMPEPEVIEDAKEPQKTK